METMLHPATSALEVPGADPELNRVDEAAIPEMSPYRLSVDQFLAMVNADIFPDEARVFLWEGRIYEKMAKTQAHTTSGNKAFLAIVRALPNGWFPGAENPIRVGMDKVPLPDLVVLRGVPDAYHLRLPETGDIGLIVEIALTSLRDDLGPKLAGYARAGIPAYWVVDLAGDRVRSFADPDVGEGVYRSEVVHHRGEFLPLALDLAEPLRIAVEDILPIREG